MGSIGTSTGLLMSAISEQLSGSLKQVTSLSLLTSSIVTKAPKPLQFKNASCYPNQTCALCFVQATVARGQQPTQSLKLNSMVHQLKAVLVTLSCAALILQPAAAYNFNFGGGYGSGIYNSAKYYQQNGIGQSQYRQDLGSALSSNGASASAAASGFSSAMANALAGGDYRTYGYSCAGAIGFGSKGSWTNAFNQAKSRGFNSSGAAAAAAATSGGQFGGDVGSATAAAAASAFGGSSASASASSSGRKLLTA